MNYRQTSLMVVEDNNTGEYLFIDSNFICDHSVTPFIDKETALDLCRQLLQFYETHNQSFLDEQNTIARTPSPIPPNEGFVYLMKRDDGLHKIGFTQNNVNVRKGQIKRQVKQNVWIVSSKWVSAPDELEASLHMRFDDLRVYGEWFDLDDKDIESVKLVLSENSIQ